MRVMKESPQIRIVIGSDHAGFSLKESLKHHLEKDGLSLLDVGTFNEDSVDYPDFAEKVARAICSGEGNLGIVLCGTGIGVSIAANKIKGIRAAVVYNDETASLARRHNNANVICFGGREASAEQAHAWTRIFLDATFEGGRHQRRIDKISALESPGTSGKS